MLARGARCATTRGWGSLRVSTCLQRGPSLRPAVAYGSSYSGDRAHSGRGLPLWGWAAVATLGTVAARAADRDASGDEDGNNESDAEVVTLFETLASPDSAAAGAGRAAVAGEEEDAADALGGEAADLDFVLAAVHRDRQHHDSGRSPLKIFSGNANKALSSRIASELGVPIGACDVKRYADGEVSVTVQETVRGCDVYIVQPTSPPVNENLMELLLLISTMRRASAKRITAILPYYGYKRDVGKPPVTPSFRARLGLYDGEDIPDSIPVSAADCARMLQEMGVDRVLAIDLQPPGHGQIEGFFDPRVPVDSLRSTAIAVSHMAAQGLENVVVVAPNEACVELAHDFRSGIDRYAKLHRGVDDPDTKLAVIVERGLSRGMDRYIHRGKGGSHMDLVGDVKDKDVVLVDDMIDTGGTLLSRIKLLKQNGARRILAFATHGLFNGPCVERIEAAKDLEQFVVTDTVPLPAKAAACNKIRQLSVAPILAAAVQRCHEGTSLQDLRVYSRDNVVPRYQGQGY